MTIIIIASLTKHGSIVLVRKNKILPPNYEIGETMEDAYVPVPHVQSRRYPCIVMYLGIVAPPDKKEQFDGKIMLKHVSEYEKVKQLSHTQQFVDD